MEKKDILISVCTVTYNHEKFIAQAIEGVLAQKCDYKIEMIIGEDCSTDGTAAIVKSYQEKYPDIIKPIFHSPNIGAQNNSLYCLMSCKGKYIAGLEGDDYWIDPLKLQRQVDMMEEHPDLAITSHGAYRLTDKLTLVDNPLENDSYWSTKDVLSDKWFIMTASLVWRRSMMNFSEPWLRKISNGDLSLILLASLNGNGFHFKEPMCVYRTHAGGAMAKFTAKDTIKHMYLFKKFDKISGYKFHEQISKRIEDIRLAIIHEYYGHNEKIGFTNKSFWINIIYALRYLKLKEIPYFARKNMRFALSGRKRKS